MKSHVPWSGTRLDRDERHHVRDQLAGNWVEVPDIDLVGTEINAEHMIAVEIGDDLVRVRPLLAGGIGSSPVADALEVVGHGANRTVTWNPKYLEVAAGIAGRKQKLARRLYTEVRRILAVRRRRVKEGQGPVRLVYHIGAHAPVGHLVDGVEVTQPRIERKEGWVRSHDEGLELQWG